MISRTSSTRLLRRWLSATAFLFLTGISAVAQAQTVSANFNTPGDVPITAASYNAAGATLEVTLNFAPSSGLPLKVIENTGIQHIQGAFSNLAHGQVLTLSFGGKNYEYVADYYGGTGNDLVLVWRKNRIVSWGLGGYQLGVTPENQNTPQLNMAPVTMTGSLSGKTVLRLAAGNNHTLALCSDGTLHSWGYNQYGQLGTGDYNHRSTPGLVQQTGVLSGKTIIAVACAYQSAFVLCSDGTLASWGFNQGGILGDGTTTTRPAPVLVSTATALSGKTPVTLSASGQHVVVLCSDGTMVGWGANNSYQLLQGGSRANESRPVALNIAGSPLASKTIVDVRASITSCTALCSDGTLASWGYNIYGVIGDGSSGDTFRTSPVMVDTSASSALQGKTVKSMAVGDAEVIALCTDGSVVSWGLWSGDGVDELARRYPVLISDKGALAGKTVIQLGNHANFKTVLCSDGSMVSWGYNGNGQLGDGTNQNRFLPVLVEQGNVAADERVVGVIPRVVGANGYAIVSTMSLPEISVDTVAGASLVDGAGTVGFGDSEPGVPTRQTVIITNRGSAPLDISSISLSGANAADFAVASHPVAPTTLPNFGSLHIVVTMTPSAVGARSAVLQINSNDGDEASFDVTLAGSGVPASTAPVNVTYTTGAEVAVTASRFTATGRTLNVTLNHVPQVGKNLRVVDNTGLAPIHGVFSNVAQGQAVNLAFGGQSYLFIANYFSGTGNDLELVWAANRLTSWGGTAYAVRNVPDAQLVGKTILQVSHYGRHVLALCSDGTLFAWGENNFGQLGNGNTGGTNNAHRIDNRGNLAGKRVVAVSAGEYHSLALCSDGTLSSWGWNNQGRLGTGTQTDRSDPGPVNQTTSALAGKRVVSIACGRDHNLVLCSDGTLVAWGSGQLGQLGDGGVTDRYLPVHVKRLGTALEGKVVTSMSSSLWFNMVICSDNSLATWGSQHLGRNIFLDSSLVPVSISNTAGSALVGRTPVSLSASLGGPSVLCSDGRLVTWGYWPGYEGASNPSENLRLPSLVDISATSALNGKTVIGHTSLYNTRFAVLSDGGMAAWGYNEEGTVGDNTTQNRLAPVPVRALPANERYLSVVAAPQSNTALVLVATPLYPEIAVEEPQSGGNLADGNGTVNFGYVIWDTKAVRTFTIRNTGLAPLTGLTIAIDGSAADEFDVITPPVSPVPPGGSTTFVLEFHPTEFNSRSAALHISSNDPDENPFDIQLYGNSYGSPDISLSELNGDSVDEGDAYDFGNAVVNVPKTRVFEIQNTGEIIMNGLSVNLGEAGGYVISTPLPVTSLAAGAKTQFAITLTASATGPLAPATLNVVSEDRDVDDPYEVTLNATGIAPSAPEIVVLDPNDNELTDNGPVINLGNVLTGAGQSRTFRIKNTGSANLTGLALSKAGTNSADIALGALSTTTLGFEAVTEFTVTVSPGAVGPRSAVVRIASNDANENPFDINLSYVGITPEIDAESPPGTALADGATLNFGTNLATGVQLTRSVLIKNTGTATLTISDIVVDGANADEFDYDLGQATIAPGASGTLDIFFEPATFGVRSAAIHLVCNDTNESPYDIKLTGTAVGPEIAVEQPAATNLTSGGSTVNFGPAVAPATVSRTFTLKNSGSSALTGIAVSFVGAGADRFAVTTAPPASIAAKGSATFTVRFTPNALQVFNATLRVASNDADENPFSIALTGEGVETLVPVFEMHPQSQIVALGQPVTFNTLVDSPTVATNQWRKGTTTFANIAGAINSSYTIAAAKLADAAVLYRNRATNAAGNTDSSTAALTVVDTTPKIFNLASGAKATFTASAATTTGTTLTYAWKKDGEPLPVDPRYVVSPPSQLVINSLQPGDTGVYTCTVTGPGGSLDGGENDLSVFDEAPAITPKPLVMPEGIVSGAYSFFIPLDETKGTATKFTATPLPAGLTLNATTGEISGNPTASKISPPYTITVTATNSLGSDSTTATLIVRPLTAGADGDYVALINRGLVNDQLGGRMEMKITTTGSYTGKMQFGSKSFTFPPGSITAAGGSSLVTGNLSVARAPLPPLVVTFTIDTLTRRITTGSVSSSGYGSSTLSGWKNVWNATTQSTQFGGYYTFSLDVPDSLAGEEDIPQGFGFGSFKAPVKGESFAVAGQMADGDAFTSSSFLGPDGEFALYDDLPSKGTVAGSMDIVPVAGPTTDNNTLTGSISWSRPESTAATASTYKAGFTPYSLALVGGRYVAPAANAIVLGKPTPATPNNGAIAFFDAGVNDAAFSPARFFSLIPGSSLTIAQSGPALTTLKITTATGVFSGEFTLRDANPVIPGAAAIVRKTKFNGILLRTPTGPKGHGYFLLPQLPRPVFPQPAVQPVLSGGVIIE